MKLSTKNKTEPLNKNNWDFSYVNILLFVCNKQIKINKTIKNHKIHEKLNFCII